MTPAKKAPARVEEAKPKKIYTIREIPVDKHTRLRRVVEVDDATCIVCGYSVLRSNKEKFPFESVDDCGPDVLPVLKRVLEKHMEAHSPIAIQAAELRSQELAEKKKVVAKE